MAKVVVIQTATVNVMISLLQVVIFWRVLRTELEKQPLI